MTSDAPHPALRWVGIIVTTLIGLMLIASGMFKILAHLGHVQVPPPSPSEPDIAWPADTMLVLGIVEIVCTLFYLFPRTSILGAVLLTGYMGGAIAAHARVHDAFFVQAIIGVFVWVGIYAREPRLLTLIPFRL